MHKKNPFERAGRCLTSIRKLWSKIQTSHAWPSSYVSCIMPWKKMTPQVCEIDGKSWLGQYQNSCKIVQRFLIFIQKLHCKQSSGDACPSSYLPCIVFLDVAMLHLIIEKTSAASIQPPNWGNLHSRISYKPWIVALKKSKIMWMRHKKLKTTFIIYNASR